MASWRAEHRRVVVIVKGQGGLGECMRRFVKLLSVLTWAICFTSTPGHFA